MYKKVQRCELMKSTSDLAFYSHSTVPTGLGVKS